MDARLRGQGSDVPQAPPRRARVAVSVLFVANGVLFAAILPRLPEIQERVGLSDGGLGVALAVGSVGGLVAGPLAGPGTARFGSGRLAVACILGYAPLLFLPGAVATGWALAVTLAWFSAADAVMDAAMNAHALRVQHAYRRSIINGFHGYFSVGAVTGALVASLAAAAGWPIAAYLAVVGLLTTVAVLSTARFLLPGSDPRAYPKTDGGPVTPGVPTGFRWRNGATAVIRGTAMIGAFSVLALVVEDVPNRWSALYLDDLGASAGVAGMGLVAMSVAMTVGRFVGDWFVNRWGAVAVVRTGMAATAIVLTLGLAASQIWAAVAAFAVVGLGVAPLFPAAMNAAAHRPGVTPGAGIAAVSWIARVGFFVAPLAVGALAEATSTAWGVGVAAAAAALLCLLAGSLRSAGTDSGTGTDTTTGTRAGTGVGDARPRRPN